MSYMFRPNAVITLDGRRFTAAEAALAGLDLQLGLGEFGEARLLLWPRSKLAGATIGAKLELALGAQGQEEAVFTGAVETVTHGPAALLIEALEPTAALHRKFISRTFLNQTVAAIVRDLADPVSVAAAESDLELGQYGVENRRSVWWHLRDLARLAGCDLGATAAGELLWRPRGRGDTRALRYGADMLAFSEGEGVAADAPAIAPHGSASAAGTDRWHWVNPDPLGQNPDPARVRGAIVSEAAATTASDAAKARSAARGKCGRVTVWGRPEVRPGDGIDLQNLPGGDSGGLLAAAATAAAAALGGAGGRRRSGMAGRARSPCLRRHARLRQRARTGRRRVGGAAAVCPGDFREACREFADRRAARDHSRRAGGATAARTRHRDPGLSGRRRRRQPSGRSPPAQQRARTVARAGRGAAPRLLAAAAAGRSGRRAVRRWRCACAGRGRQPLRFRSSSAAIRRARRRLHPARRPGQRGQALPYRDARRRQADDRRWRSRVRSRRHEAADRPGRRCQRDLGQGHCARIRRAGSRSRPAAT